MNHFKKVVIFMLFACANACAANVLTPAFSLQAQINAAANGRLVIPAGTYNTSGLTCVSNITIESDGPVNFISSTAAPILDLSNCENVTLRGDFKFVGNGPTYAGYGSTMTDGGQIGIKLYNSKNINIEGRIEIANIAGNGLDAQNPSFAFNVQTNNHIRGLIVHDSYRGVYLHNYAEYMTFSDFNVNNNVFGILVESGNDSFVNGKTIYNSIGVKLYGGPNNAHGTFASLESNHNTYNLVAQNVAYGESFSGCNFISEQSGSGHGVIQIVNSQGVDLVGGIIGSDITVDATSVLSAQSNFIRTDLAALPSVAVGGLLVSKNNFTTAGLWSGNN